MVHQNGRGRFAVRPISFAVWISGAARSAGSRVVLPNPSRLLSVVPAVCRLPL